MKIVLQSAPESATTLPVLENAPETVGSPTRMSGTPSRLRSPGAPTGGLMKAESVQRRMSEQSAPEKIRTLFPAPAARSEMPSPFRSPRSAAVVPALSELTPRGSTILHRDDPSAPDTTTMLPVWMLPPAA